MAQKITTVDAYLKAVPADLRQLLVPIRAAILAAAPGVTEKIAYNVPYYSLGRPLIAWKANKGCVSLIAMSRAALSALQKELTGYELSGTTIHIYPGKPLPQSVVKKIVKLRLAENAARAKVGRVPRVSQRKRYPMPVAVKTALVKAGLMADYEARPAYQRNDYLMWISQAKQEATKSKRLDQMLSELKQGGVYMNMKHPSSIKKK